MNSWNDMLDQFGLFLVVAVDMVDLEINFNKDWVGTDTLYKPHQNVKGYFTGWNMVQCQ